ncbi:hypothetical protein BBG47_24875 [Paenibacillus sp. KS1]|nr:hypothetical protein BBG47_24875 [Paenibacillus sp. KS1]
MAAMDASTWMNENMNEWLDEKTQQICILNLYLGLALLDVTDVIRPYPEVIECLHNMIMVNFYDGLIQLKGGQETQDAIYAFLNKYGMRCAGEIDGGC